MTDNPVAHVVKENLVSKVLEKRSIEQQTLECLLRIECDLANMEGALVHIGNLIEWKEGYLTPVNEPTKETKKKR